MTQTGLFIMTLSMGTVLSLVGFCLYKVLSTPPMEPHDDEDEQPIVESKTLA